MPISDLVNLALQLLILLIPIVLLVLLVWCLVLLTKDIRHSIRWILNSHRAFKLVRKGAYEDSLKIYLSMNPDRFLMLYGKKIFKNQLLYNLANLYFRKGDFEKSVSSLEQLIPEKLDRNLKACYYNLYAINLLMLERDFEQAEQYLKKAGSLVVFPWSEINQAYVRLLKGDEIGVDQIVERFKSKPSSKRRIIFGLISPLYLDLEFSEIGNNFMLGAYYLKKRDFLQAKEYLLRASRSGYKNCFSERAESLLKTISV